MKRLLSLIVLLGSALSGPAQAADEVTLRVHHFMSAKAQQHSVFLSNLAQRLSDSSDGRLKLELFDSMSLGGRPGDLYDQAVDGAVDIILTLPGYTPGRFNQTEVFELPFLTEDSVVASKALWDLIESDLQESEYQDVKILACWVHGPGRIHSIDPITTLEDMKGKDVRGPTRLITDLISELGANPVGMPLPAIPENLSKGVMSAVMLPWEITPSIKLHEMVHNHVELSGPALYTATFIMAMNWDAYESMPDDLREILDAELGKALSEEVGTIVAEADAIGRELAEQEGNSIVKLDADETARWIKAAQPVYQRFVDRATEEGFDGAALIEKVQSLIEANQ